MKKNDTNIFRMLWYSYPRAAIALMLVFVNLGVILLFTGILTLVKGASFVGELSYLFTYTMCSDGIYDFVNNQEDVTCFVIKIILTVVQMVIFSGALIGFTTDILQSTIDKRLNNIGKLRLKNHFVFLNWSAIGPNLIYDLSFLEGKKTVVILSEKDRDEILTSIENIYTENDRKMRGIRLFIKNGSPSSTKHLADISLSEAEYVGVLLTDAEGTDSSNISNKDLVSFKTLMAVMNRGTKSNIVVEVETDETVSKIERFIKETDESLLGRVSVFAHNSVIGHVLGRTVINPIYSHLFHKVLSYEGCEFYRTEGKDVEEALYNYNECIPIINYDENGNNSPDRLYVLAEGRSAIKMRNESKSFVKEIGYCENIERDEFALIIFSDSDRSKFVIEEIETYNKVYNKNITYQLHSFDDDIDETMESIQQLSGEKRILLLSSEKDEEAGQDADVFNALLSFKISGKLEEGIPIFAEIVNPKNLVAMQNLGVVSIIVSNRIISLFMMQLLTHKGSRKFYRDIIVANGEKEGGNVDFDIVKAKDILKFTEDKLVFSCKSELVQSFYISSNKTRMCIGIKYEGDADSAIKFLCTGMDEKKELVISPEDELILVNY